MKKLFSTLTLAACLGVFVSCTDNEQEMDMFKPANTNSEIEVINGGTMIKFRDMSAYQNALLKVSAMSAQERINYLDSLSFKPQVMIMKEADGELENICIMAADRTSFDALYQKYKQKYGQVFMFNESDPSDLSPYSRLFCPVDEHFVNSEGQFMIGDSLVNSKMYNDFEESEQQFTMVTTRDASTITSVNNAYSRQSKRKVGLRLTTGGSDAPGKTYIHATFTSQKKGAFGWVRYSTNYHVWFNIYGANFEFAQGGFLGYGPVYVPQDGYSFEFAIEMGGNETKILGRKSDGVNCFGSFEVWSRGVPYEQRGVSSVNL